jgi:ABC-type Mn2+/Zn2+ transport system ATPase subunit
VKDGVPAIRVENLTVSYRGKPAVRNVTVAVEQGLRVGLVGPNGAGKSTLLRALVGLLAPDTGQVELFGRPVREARKLVAYVPQRSEVDWTTPWWWRKWSSWAASRTWAGCGAPGRRTVGWPGSASARWGWRT